MKINFRFNLGWFILGCIIGGILGSIIWKVKIIIVGGIAGLIIGSALVIIHLKRFLSKVTRKQFYKK